MPTLRDMLIEIYQPRRGIIEFPRGPDEGGNALAVLGSGAGMGGGQESSAERGGSVPTSVGGFSGAADTGMRELGQGFIGGDEFGGQQGRIAELARRMRDDGEREGSGFEGGTPEGYVDLSGWPEYALGALGLLPGPIGMFGAAVGTGIRGGNAALLDKQLREAGFSQGLSALQTVGGALGLNDYGEGSWEGNLAGSATAQRSALAGDQSFGSLSGTGSAYRTSPAGPTANLSGGQDPGAVDVAGSAFESMGPSRAMERATRSLDFGLDRGRDGGSGGGSAEGRGGNVGDRGGIAGPGGRNTFHSGGHLSEDMVPGMERGDVPITAQEGEYVISADAVEMIGPEFFEGLNKLAGMMRQFHPRQATMHDGGRVRRDYY